MSDCTDKTTFERAAEEFEANNVNAASILTTLALAEAEARGIIDVNGVKHMHDAKGRLVPVSQVRETDLLTDQTVRSIMDFASKLSAQVGRFRAHTFDDVDALVALLKEKYGAKTGGVKGNITLTTFDGLMMVKVQVADNIIFGPELQAAKSLVDECLTEWSDGAHANLRTIVDRAFAVDQEGRINRGELLGLRRLKFGDDRWARAMEAINDSIQIIGSKRYVRIYRRDHPTAGWQPVPIDVAAS